MRRLAPDRLEITLREGRKRQVKRMCEHVGHRVRALERVAFGPLELGDLAPGRHRRLTAAEVRRWPAAAPNRITTCPEADPRRRTALFTG